MPTDGTMIIDDKALQRVFRTLPGAVQRRSARKAVTAGATPILRAARADAPVDSGLLAKAMAKKVRTYRSGIAVAIVGAKMDLTGEFDGKLRRPGKYLHLVELGHVNRDGTWTSGKHFLEQATERTANEALNTMRAKLDESVQEEAAKA